MDFIEQLEGIVAETFKGASISEHAHLGMFFELVPSRGCSATNANESVGGMASNSVSVKILLGFELPGTIALRA